MSNRLSGAGVLSYLGTNAQNPSNVSYATRSPNQNDDTNFSLGDLWINTEDLTVWLLVSLQGTTNSGGYVATWTQLGIITTNLETLTGNSGGAIDPDSSNTIFVRGDGTTITIIGDASAHTLTASLIDGSYIGTVTGNSGGAVSPDGSGNLTIVGDGSTISIVGNPGTHTLTASVISSVSITLEGNSGGAVSPSGGNINVVGDGTTIDIIGTPGNNTLTASIISGGAIQSLTGDNDTVHVTPDVSGTINIVGTPGFVTVSGNNATHTLTIDADSEVATLYDADIGSAVPSSNTLIIAGGTNINTDGSGNTITVNLDTTLTGITSLTTDNIDVITSATMSFMNEGVVQSDNAGHLSSSKGTDGQLLIGSSTGAPAWANITAGANITVTNGHNSITISATGGSGSSGLVLIDSKTATGLSNVAFTSGISSTYKTYLLVVDRLVIPAGMASFGVIALALSFDGGATYPTSNYTTGINYSLYNSSAISNYNNSATLTNYIWMGPIFNGLGTSQYISFTAYLYDITTGNWAKNFYGQFTNYTGSTLYGGQGVGTYTGGSFVSSSNPPVNAIKILTVGVGGFTTFSAGTVELYGFVD